jgi:uncharacterized protein (DUF58 family)
MKSTQEQVAAIMASALVTEVPLRWKSASRMPGGSRRSKYKGSGQEFFELSEYREGDDARLINWHASAKSTTETLYKTVRIESRQAYFCALVDVSPTMDFGTKRVTKRFLAAELLGSIVGCAKKLHDKLAFTAYSSTKVESFFKVTSANKISYPAIASVLENKPSYAPPANGLAQALTTLPRIRSLVFIVSDFMNMSEADWKALHNAGVFHDVVCFYVQDIRERELPIVPWPGCPYTLKDPYGNTTTIWNDRCKAPLGLGKLRGLLPFGIGNNYVKYAENFRQHESTIIARLAKCNCQRVVISTEEGDAAIPKLIDVFKNHVS